MKTHHGPLTLALSLSIALAPVPVLAATQDPATMSDEDKMARAKQLYGEGDKAFNDGDAATALTKFEEAYNVYAPSLHVFNMNIGLAAFELGDCVKAKTAFQRFLDLVSDHPARGQAQEKLLEIERSGCANAAPEPEPAPVTTTPISAEYENQDAPELTSRRSEREEAAESEREEVNSKKASGKLIAGAALTGLGVAAIIGGGVSLGIANKRANTLAELASPGPTGFPSGDYSDNEVASLDRTGLKAANNASVALFVGGGVLATVGVVLIVLDITGKMKAGLKGGKNARTPERGPHLTGLGPTILPGGGGASASLRF